MSEINYEALDESIEYLDLVSEGVNAELWKGSKKYKKEYREATKAAKKAVKEKRWSDAKSALKEAGKVADDYAKFIDGIKAEEGDYFTTVVGWLVSGINDFTIYWKEMLIGIGGGIAGGAAGGAIGGATGGEIGAHFGASVGAEIGMLPGLVLETIKGVKETIKQVRMMISNFKKDKENGVDAMNKYRVQCKVLAKDFAKQAQDAIKLVDKLEKEDKAADK